MQYSVDLGNRQPVSRVYIDWKLQSNIYLYVLRKIDCIIVSRSARSCAVVLQRVSIALLLVCLSSDVEVNPGPVGTSSIPVNAPPPCIQLFENSPRLCHSNMRSFSKLLRTFIKYRNRCACFNWILVRFLSLEWWIQHPRLISWT